MENAGDLYAFATAQAQASTSTAVARQYSVIAEHAKAIVEMQEGQLPEVSAQETQPVVDFKAVLDKLALHDDNIDAIYHLANSALSEASKSAQMASDASLKCDGLLRVNKPVQNTINDFAIEEINKVAEMVKELTEWKSLPWWKRLFK